MCGRYIFISSPDDLKKEIFFDSIQGSWEPRINISPGMMIPCMIAHREEKRVGLLKWGLIPHWAKDSKIANQLINARSETLFEKASFRDAVKQKRCLIFANAYFEWVNLNGQKKIILCKHSRDKIMTFAGVWSSWIDSHTKEKCYTTAIITCPSTSSIEKYHDRMPVIIASENRQKWLDLKTKKEELTDLFKSDPMIIITKTIDKITDDLFTDFQ